MSDFPGRFVQVMPVVCVAHDAHPSSSHPQTDHKAMATNYGVMNMSITHHRSSYRTKTMIYYLYIVRRWTDETHLNLTCVKLKADEGKSKMSHYSSISLYDYTNVRFIACVYDDVHDMNKTFSRTFRTFRTTNIVTNQIYSLLWRCGNRAKKYSRGRAANNNKNDVDEQQRPLKKEIACSIKIPSPEYGSLALCFFFSYLTMFFDRKRIWNCSRWLEWPVFIQRIPMHYNFLSFGRRPLSLCLSTTLNLNHNSLANCLHHFLLSIFVVKILCRNI